MSRPDSRTWIRSVARRPRAPRRPPRPSPPLRFIPHCIQNGEWWTHGLPRAVGGRVFATEPRRQQASRPPRPPGTSSSEAATLEDDLSPWWWTHRPDPGAAIGEPFEHDSRTASGAGGRPAGAALESAPGRAVAARRFRRREGGARRGRRWKSPGPKVDGTPVIRPTVTARRRLDSASSSSPSARAAAGEMR